MLATHADWSWLVLCRYLVGGLLR